MTALKDRFWAKVAFKEFIRHYRKMTAEQKAADIDASMDALEDLDDTGNSFGSKMVRWSMERVDQYPMAQENGKKGGRPRKSLTADGDSANIYGDAAISDFSEARESQRRAGADSVRGMAKVAQPPVRSGRKFRNKEEFIQWAIDTGLDPNDAGDCWEATMERGGLTKDGKKVDNICAYTVKWCRTSKKNRETA